MLLVLLPCGGTAGSPAGSPAGSGGPGAAFGLAGFAEATGGGPAGTGTAFGPAGFAAGGRPAGSGGCLGGGRGGSPGAGSGRIGPPAKSFRHHRAGLPRAWFKTNNIKGHEACNCYIAFFCPLALLPEAREESPAEGPASTRLLFLSAIISCMLDILKLIFVIPK